LKKNVRIGLILSILAFIASCILAFVLESIVFIYIASVIPILIVWFMPDVRPSQWIRPGQGKRKALIYKIQGQEPSENDLIVISFDQGYVNWNKHMLYFSLDKLPVMNDRRQGEQQLATLSVVKHDLHLHPRKRRWVGIDLHKLAERAKFMPFTTNEVNRLVIRLADVAAVAGKRRSSQGAARSRSAEA